MDFQGHARALFNFVGLQVEEVLPISGYSSSERFEF